MRGLHRLSSLDKLRMRISSTCLLYTSQLKEMIRQHYNHPSICFWGLFNELKEKGDNPVEYIKELNAIAHQEDPTRPTTSASNQMCIRDSPCSL